MNIPKEELEKLSSNDLALYFRESYVLATRPNDKKAAPSFFYVFGVDGGKLQGSFSMNSPSSEWISIDNLAVPFYLKSGWYNLDESCVLWKRKPTRTPTKGLAGHTFDPLYFRDILVGMKLLHVNERKFFRSEKALPFWCSDTLNVLLSEEGKEYEFQQIYKDTENGAFLSRALNRDICLSIGIRDFCPSLWFRDHYVGKALSRFKVLVEFPEFLPEICDNLEPQGVNVTCA